MGEYMQLTAKTKEHFFHFFGRLAVQTGNPSHLERARGLLFGSASPQALARFDQETLVGSAILAANPVLHHPRWAVVARLITCIQIAP